MAKSQVIYEWNEAYTCILSDGPDNEIKPKRMRPTDYSSTFFVNHVLAVRLPSGREEVRRSRGIHECKGGSRDEMSHAIEQFIQQADVRLLADHIRVNEDGDVPTKEPLTQELTDGSAAIYQPKDHIRADG